MWYSHFQLDLCHKLLLRLANFEVSALFRSTYFTNLLEIGKTLFSVKAYKSSLSKTIHYLLPPFGLKKEEEGCLHHIVFWGPKEYFWRKSHFTSFSTIKIIFTESYWRNLTENLCFYNLFWFDSPEQQLFLDDYSMLYYVA